MHKQRISILLLLSVLLLSCGKPSWVLSEKQMEDILFDIHIADAEINNNYMDFRIEKQKQKLYTSIFEKHKITREQFDTSLVWYGKNLTKYLEIYEKLIQRYAILSDSIMVQIDRQKAQTLASDSDLVNLWEKPRAFILTSLAGKNIISFDVDSLKLSPKEYFKFTFNVLGITDSIAIPLVSFGIEYPDSVFVEREKMTDNGFFSIAIPPADSISDDPARLFGSIYLPYRKEYAQIVIYNMGLYKLTDNREP